MKLAFEQIIRSSDHKYLMLIAGVLGIAYYVGSYVMAPSAEKVYSQDMEAIMARANACLFEKKYQDAICLYDTLITHDAHCAPAHFNKGQALLSLQQWHEASSSYQNALDSGMRAEHLHLVHFNYGTALFRLNEHEKAIVHLSHAVAHNAFAPAYAQRALAYEALKNYDAAYQDITRACSLAFEPPYAQALIKIGNRYRDQENFSQAETCYQKAIEYMPQEAQYYLNLADVLHLRGRKEHDTSLITQSMNMYAHAAQLDPSNHLAYHNHACMLLEQGDEEHAYALMQKALACAPDHAPTHLVLSCYYLQNGDFEHGWQEYEWRNVSENKTRHDTRPRWNGSSSLTGKTILLHAEQGFGDTFQFIRYAREVKQRGAQCIIVEVQPALKPIISLCPYIDRVVASTDPMPAYDLQAHLMSLPLIMQTRLETIPHETPYLYADQKLTQHWQQKFANNDTLKIGMCWRVNANHDVIKYRNSDITLEVTTPLRSIPITSFASLARMPGVTLYSLQKECLADADLIKQLSIKEFGPYYDTAHGAFMDTAAIMKQLDLVITADTSIAHLAGGLGIPVWILVPHQAEWRWLKDRNDSPWYPTARIFRQQSAGNWESIMNAVQAELKKRAAHKPT